MKSSLKKLPQSQVELSFSLDPVKLEEQREIAFKKLASQVKVPGFRPGKAPRRMIEEHMNPSAPMQQALDVILNEAYQEALKEHDLTPVAQPEVNIESLDLTKPISVKATGKPRRRKLQRESEPDPCQSHCHYRQRAETACDPQRGRAGGQPH